jgi:hypothetical protein
MKASLSSDRLEMNRLPAWTKRSSRGRLLNRSKGGAEAAWIAFAGPGV